MAVIRFKLRRFYHSEKLQSTKTTVIGFDYEHEFYHSEKLQSTKTNGEPCIVNI